MHLTKEADLEDNIRRGELRGRYADNEDVVAGE
jgi:hypothetical protein